MPKFAANLSTMFQEADFLDRFELAAAVGFKAVELQYPYEYRPEQIGKRLTDLGLELVAFNSPPGNFRAGERGLAALHGREEDFTRSIARALEYLEATGCKRLHVMAGVVEDRSDIQHSTEHYVDSLRYSCAQCAPLGVTVLIEPINAVDQPDYFMCRPLQALDMIEALHEKGLALQYDVFHAQVMEGDITTTLSANIDVVGHIQIASVPFRDEPDTGEVNYPFLFDLLDELGYDGWIGCEYNPRGFTLDGLGWVMPYLKPAE
jgi:hydroxypyruvate isomerase